MGMAQAILYVEVRIQTPGKLNKRQRELLAELGELAPVETSRRAGRCWDA